MTCDMDRLKNFGENDLFDQVTLNDLRLAFDSIVLVEGFKLMHMYDL